MPNVSSKYALSSARGVYFTGFECFDLVEQPELEGGSFLPTALIVHECFSVPRFYISMEGKWVVPVVGGGGVLFLSIFDLSNEPIRCTITKVGFFKRTIFSLNMTRPFSAD